MHDDLKKLKKKLKQAEALVAETYGKYADACKRRSEIKREIHIKEKP